METYGLYVGEDKRRGITWHAQKQWLVSGVAESSQVAGSISRASKATKSNADNRRESIGRHFEDKIQLT